MKKPNIVFVLTDDQGYGDLGCHGNSVLKTPYIDLFYNESCRFTNYHVGPTCAPTRSGLFTGHYANSTGVWHTVGGRSLLRKDEVTIADVLSENSYVTGLFGKWHLGDNHPYRPQDRGFQQVICHGGGGISQVPDYWQNDYFDDVYSVNGEAKRFKGYCTDVFFDEALKFIESNQDNPFACFITCNAPHDPYNVDSKYSEPYKDRVSTRDRANFYGMISNIDENFGRLQKHLKDLNLLDDTILIFMTDNGTSCNDSEYNTCGMTGCKNSEYDGGHRVPFFISYPNGNLHKNMDIDSLTSHIDVMPTLLELCHINLADYAHCNFHGISLKDAMQNLDYQLPERVIVTDSQRLPNPVKWRKSAVMTDQWRLINGTELYDINLDLAQKNDIADAHPEVVEQLRKEYEKWWELVSQQFNEELPISIGSDKEKSACLTAHDLRHFDNPIFTDPFVAECNDYLVYNQSQVRQGAHCGGYFEISVEKAGRYSFELRRWPKAEDISINSGIADSTENWRSDVISAKHHCFYSGGKAMNFVTGNIEIGDIKKSIEINSQDKSAILTVDLPQGTTHLVSYFEDDKGNKHGCYYTYIELL